MESRLEKQIDFLREIDKMKEIERQTYIVSGKKAENDAEHSWHLAIMAMVLKEYFPESTDMIKVVKMVLIHDIVEVYAGDTYCYDTAALADKKEREMASAQKIYSLLPDEQKEEYMNLWLEFEDEKTVEAKCAVILDHLQPVILNYYSGGKSWTNHGVYADQVLGRNKLILEEADENIRQLFLKYINSAIEKGWLKTR